MLGKPRRFGMGDLMILIAAMGVGVWGMKGLWLSLDEGLFKDWWPRTPAYLVATTMVAALLTPLTLAALAFRLRQPRASWRRALIRPGSAAMLVCGLVFLVRSLGVAAAFNAPKRSMFDAQVDCQVRIGQDSHLLYVLNKSINGSIGIVRAAGCLTVTVAGYVYPCGHAVGAVWLLLATMGRWRPEKSWIDRLGRGLGLCWS